MDLQVDGLVLAKKKITHWFPNSDATKRKPDFRIHRLEAMGTVSKYLILSDFTSSSSCSIVILYKSPSSLCSRKKKAPYVDVCQKLQTKAVLTHLHFMHHRCNNNDSPSALSERVLPPRNGDAMLRCVSISINDMVFRAHKYTRGTIKTLGGGELATGNLYEEICSGICGLAPFSYDVVEAQIKFVVG